MAHPRIVRVKVAPLSLVVGAAAIAVGTLVALATGTMDARPAAAILAIVAAVETFAALAALEAVKLLVKVMVLSQGHALASEAIKRTLQQAKDEDTKPPLE